MTRVFKGEKSLGQIMEMKQQDTLDLFPPKGPLIEPTLHHTLPNGVFENVG